jgi:hypothetical protein
MTDVVVTNYKNEKKEQQQQTNWCKIANKHWLDLLICGTTDKLDKQRRHNN